MLYSDPRIKALVTGNQNFLLVTLTNQLSISVFRGLYARGNMLIRNFRQCYLRVKLKLFQIFCANFYCCGLRNDFRQCTLDKVKVSYNNVFRALLKLNRRISMSHTFVSFNIPSFPVIQRKLMFSVYKRILKSDNCLVKSVVNSTHFLQSNLYRYWLLKLYTF